MKNEMEKIGHWFLIDCTNKMECDSLNRKRITRIDLFIVEIKPNEREKNDDTFSTFAFVGNCFIFAVYRFAFVLVFIMKFESFRNLFLFVAAWSSNSSLFVFVYFYQEFYCSFFFKKNSVFFSATRMLIRFVILSSKKSLFFSLSLNNQNRREIISFFNNFQFSILLTINFILKTVENKLIYFF